jgi:hypothetical protein
MDINRKQCAVTTSDAGGDIQLSDSTGYVQFLLTPAEAQQVALDLWRNAGLGPIARAAHEPARIEVSGTHVVLHIGSLPLPISMPAMGAIYLGRELQGAAWRIGDIQREAGRHDLAEQINTVLTGYEKLRAHDRAQEMAPADPFGAIDWDTVQLTYAPRLPHPADRPRHPMFGPGIAIGAPEPTTRSEPPTPAPARIDPTELPTPLPRRTAERWRQDSEMLNEIGRELASAFELDEVQRFSEWGNPLNMVRELIAERDKLRSILELANRTSRRRGAERDQLRDQLRDAAGTGARLVLAGIPSAHIYTAHGWPCCRYAPIRESWAARGCAGPGHCLPCAEEASAAHEPVPSAPLRRLSMPLGFERMTDADRERLGFERMAGAPSDLPMHDGGQDVG